MPWGHVISTAGGGSVSVLGAGGAPPAHGLDLGRDVPVYCVSNYETVRLVHHPAYLRLLSLTTLLFHLPAGHC
jgi:hypothetical protein